jgi:hypothetical protein
MKAKAKAPVITFTVEAAEEDLPVRGNAVASGDPRFDRQVEDEILERLARGDYWAWCYVTVEARLEFAGTVFIGSDTMGTCSYSDKASFLADAYFADMKVIATEDLKRVLRDAIDR